MLGRITTQFKNYGWNFAFRPHDIGKELGRTIFFGLSIGAAVKALVNIAEGSADKKTIALRKERLAMVWFVDFSQYMS